MTVQDLIDLLDEYDKGLQVCTLWSYSRPPITQAIIEREEDGTSILVLL